MSSSKAEYLSKYYNDGDGSGSDDQKRKQKKKKKKKKKHKVKQEVVLLHDSEEEDLAVTKIDDDEDANDDEVEVSLVMNGYPPAEYFTGGDEEEGVSDIRVVVYNRLADTVTNEHDVDSNSETGQRGSTRRNRHDSDSESDSSNNNRRKRDRHDSSSEESEKESKMRRQRYDSDSDGGKSQESSNSKDSSVDARGRQAKMASGHAAGLQRAQEFSTAERTIQAKRKLEAAALVDQHGMGDTVYRDAEGRKQQALPSSQQSNKAQQQHQRFLLNQGKRQVQAQVDKHNQEKQLQQSSFARTIQDQDLEDWKKHQSRAGDPMAAAARAAAPSPHHQSSKQKPIYKGPAPPPNRFQIKPGYRWDGNHRGNGFETKLLARKFGKERDKEKAYRWSTADM